MNRRRTQIRWGRIVASALSAALATLPGPGAHAQQVNQEQFVPRVGQPGKDVVWVPTPEALVEKMLDLAQVTPEDFVMDLGSGDGRNVIAAAKRGARGLGVEYNPDMVQLSRRLAAEAGVADRAQFVEGDMYEADISKATVLALFLLPENLTKLRDKFLALKPGSRIVVNTFGIEDWDPDETVTIEGECGSWCTAMLYIVPARVEGVWRMPQGELTITQSYQKISGTLTTNGKSMPIANGRIRGDVVAFTAGDAEYSGRVAGESVQGTVTRAGRSAAWTAARKPAS